MTFVLIGACVVCLAALIQANREVRCIECGRECATRIGGGTVDRPLCWRCAAASNRKGRN